jgi:hypothetical protein
MVFESVRIYKRFSKKHVKYLKDVLRFLLQDILNYLI